VVFRGGCWRVASGTRTSENPAQRKFREHPFYSGLQCSWSTIALPWRIVSPEGVQKRSRIPQFTWVNITANCYRHLGDEGPVLSVFPGLTKRRFLSYSNDEERPLAPAPDLGVGAHRVPCRDPFTPVVHQPTRTTANKHETYSEKMRNIAGISETLANNYDVMDLPSHGRGRWFDPSIAHSSLCFLSYYRFNNLAAFSDALVRLSRELRRTPTYFVVCRLS